MANACIIHPYTQEDRLGTHAEYVLSYLEKLPRCQWICSIKDLNGLTLHCFITCTVKFWIFFPGKFPELFFECIEADTPPARRLAFCRDISLQLLTRMDSTMVGTYAKLRNIRRPTMTIICCRWSLQTKRKSTRVRRRSKSSHVCKTGKKSMHSEETISLRVCDIALHLHASVITWGLSTEKSYDTWHCSAIAAPLIRMRLTVFGRVTRYILD